MTQIFDFLKIIAFATFFALLIHIFVLLPYQVTDDGMLPEYRKGDVIIVNRLPSYKGIYNRSDIVIFRDTKDYSRALIRRVAALPGERIAINDGVLKINGSEQITKELPIFSNVSRSTSDVGNLDAHEYYVLGDSDYENGVGLVDIRFILGTPLIKIWPL